MGLDSGMVVIGSIGDDPDAELAAIGETVNTAERLQGQAEPGTIVASEATARLVAGAIRLEPLGPLEVRGGSVPVGAHLVLGVGPERSPQRGLDPRTLGPFVGRERPLAALGEAVAEAREGRGQVVGVVGEPGMGKPRLVTELRRSLSGERITLTEGRCLLLRPLYTVPGGAGPHPGDLRDHGGRHGRNDEREASLLSRRDRPRPRRAGAVPASPARGRGALRCARRAEPRGDQGAHLRDAHPDGPQRQPAAPAGARV